MNMQTIQLDVSNDIFDKVMAFLEIFPKDKIQLINHDSSKKVKKKKNSLGDFFNPLL